jgi:Domain of unknown function (DUF4145)
VTGLSAGEAMAQGEVDMKKIYCNACKRATNHNLEGKHRWTDDDPDGIGEETIESFWVCAGCEVGALETAYSNAFIRDDQENQIFEYTYHPRRNNSDLEPKTFIKLKPKLSLLYKETISCFNDGAFVLCTAGLRALLEGICQDKHITGKNLKIKIEGLNKFFPSKNIVKNLHHFRFIGNQALHELVAPKTEDIKLAIEVMEDLMNFLYELDYKT